MSVAEAKDAEQGGINERIVAKIKSLNPRIRDLRIIQQRSISQGLLTTDKNFVVIGPTASGKTMVGELAALKEIEENGKILYLVPLQQLVAEKQRELAYLERGATKGKPKKGSGEADAEESGKNITIMTFETFYRTAVRQSHI